MNGGRPEDRGVFLPPILVAEDDAASRELLCAFFAKMRVANPIVLAADGAQAIAHLELARAGEAPHPVFMVLDQNMPLRSGLDVLRWCRSQGLDIPAIMLTASSEGGDIDESYALGAVVYLVKPLGFRALEDVLRSLPAPWAFLGQPGS